MNNLDVGKIKIVGVVGLGLIGGSVAKAYRKYSGVTVYGYDKDDVVQGYAELEGTVSGKLTKEKLAVCDVVFIALYPSLTIDYLKNNAEYFGKNKLVMDLCGVKSEICSVGFELASKHGFVFAGGHPMAGKHLSGYKYSSAELFKGAPMVVVPDRFDDIELLSNIKEILSPLQIGSVSVTDAGKHDEIIAFTSQLAHIVSNAYVKSPTAKIHKGFSAGSYKDLTRVAWLSEQMWSELFLENSENVLSELDCIIEKLTEYRDAIRNGDKTELVRLLREGREAKEEIDGKAQKK